MTTTQTKLTRTAAEIYFESWRSHDFDRLRTVLDPTVDFAGPLGTADGIEACIASLKAMAETVMSDVLLKARIVEGEDVVTWFDLIAKDAPPIPTANWSRVRGGMITSIRVAFDPRPLLG